MPSERVARPHAVQAFRLALTMALFAASIVPARAQLRAAAPVNESTTSYKRELTGNKEWHFIGSVEMERGDTKIFADDVRWFTDTNKAVATGNVVLQQANNRI